MNCGAVERWLNEGMPGTGAATARAHAAHCPLCGPRLAAAERVEALLATAARGTPAAPAGFADRVLAWVEADSARRAPAGARAAVARPVARPAHPLAWWIRAGADPAIPIAIAFASVFVGFAQAAGALARRPIASPLPTLDWSAVSGALGDSPFAQTAVTLSVLGLVLLGSYALFQAVQRSVRAPARRWYNRMHG
jgi:hypothetical protein